MNRLFTVISRLFWYGFCVFRTPRETCCRIAIGVLLFATNQHEMIMYSTSSVNRTLPKFKTDNVKKKTKKIEDRISVISEMQKYKFAKTLLSGKKAKWCWLNATQTLWYGPLHSCLDWSPNETQLTELLSRKGAFWELWQRLFVFCNQKSACV